jgi:hypothetical protein
MYDVERVTNNGYAIGLIASHLAGRDFAASEVKLTESETKGWVRMRSNPPRFQPQIFIGSWANPNAHPTAGEIRVIRVMTGPDAVTRVIARQGKYLYCYPWM